MAGFLDIGRSHAHTYVSKAAELTLKSPLTIELLLGRNIVRGLF